MIEFILLTAAFILLFLLSRRQPIVAASLLPFFLPLYLFRFSILAIPTNVLEIAILIITIAQLTLPGAVSLWKKAFARLPPFISALVFLFVLSAIISTFASPHPLTSLGILKGWIFIPILGGWLTYLAVNKQGASAIIKNLIIVGTVTALLGLIMPDSSGRLIGIYDVPNSLALFLVPIITLTWLLALTSSPSPQKVILVTSAALMTIALFGTQSVAGLLALLASLIIGLLIWRPPSGLKFIAGAIIIITILGGSYLSYTGKISYLLAPLSGSPYRNSLTVRLQLWSIGAQLIQDHPISGIGLGTFEPAYQEKLRQRFQQFETCDSRQTNCLQPLAEYVFRDPHNWIISFWLNLGLLGLTAFVGLHAYLAWRIRRSYQLPVTDYQLPAVALALLSLLIFGLADTIYWKNDLAALHFILIALLMRGQEP